MKGDFEISDNMNCLGKGESVTMQKKKKLRREKNVVKF
jgi:hypothetical protein